MLNKKALAGSVSAPPAIYPEDVFSTYLYTGTGATQTINNGIDLSGKGGMVWLKRRELTSDSQVFDTLRGTGNLLATNQTSGQSTGNTDTLQQFNSNGFNVGANYGAGASGGSYCSWTFREQPKFFDVVTYTGDGTTDRNVPHNLGSQPGMVIIKATSASSDWNVRHVALGSSTIKLNTTAAAQNIFNPYNTDMTSTTFYATTISNPTYSSYATNNSGVTYVAYLFAHNAGGFGTAGTDNVISCGSFVTGSTGVETITLGYEPQYVMFKRADSTSGWIILDTMRGFPNGSVDAYLEANTSAAETTAGYGHPTATGFVINAGFGSGQTYIYMAIRRPMKVPTTGTSVFSPNTETSSTSPQTVTTGFPVDLCINTIRNGGFGSTPVMDRLRGGTTTSYNFLTTTTTAAESTGGGAGLGFDNNIGLIDNGWLTNTNAILWNFRRAPGFFEQICYVGSGSGGYFNHNLTVIPELVIIKRRNGSGNWVVSSRALQIANSAATQLNLNSTAAGATGPGADLPSATNTQFWLNSDAADINASGWNYVMYLFATVAGVSKVGSYTGNGSSQTINCGFTAGARFVLIKRTDSTGDWCVFDTARGIVSGNDPFLQLNSTAVEVTGEDAVDPANSGFIINETTEALNTNAATYIFLAIA